MLRSVPTQMPLADCEAPHTSFGCLPTDLDPIASHLNSLVILRQNKTACGLSNLHVDSSVSKNTRFCMHRKPSNLFRILTSDCQIDGQPLEAQFCEAVGPELWLRQQICHLDDSPAKSRWLLSNLEGRVQWPRLPLETFQNKNKPGIWHFLLCKVEVLQPNQDLLFPNCLRDRSSQHFWCPTSLWQM